MTNVVRRVLVFFLGLPLLAASVFAFPQQNHPLFIAIAVVASAMSALELKTFFPVEHTGYKGSSLVFLLIGGVPPLVAALVVVFELSLFYFTALFAVIVGLTLSVQVLRHSPQEFVGINGTITSHLFVSLYPGLLAAHVVFMTDLPMSSLVLLLYLLSVYLNDSMAYVTGMLLGRRSRPLLAISPNKTRVGFFGGFLSSVLTTLLAAEVLPQLLPGSWLKALLFGALIGVVTIAGDLAESALKRSAEIKDSGNLIPGRGGLLDSIDSPLFVAPFFFYAYQLLYVL